MKTIRMIVVASLIGVPMGAAVAQHGGGMGPGSGPGPMAAGPAASAPGMGPGGTHGAARWGSNYTPGWALMTEQERNEHRERMRSMKTYEECKTYHAQHHEQMAARAKERGGKAMPKPRHDACRGLKK